MNLVPIKKIVFGKAQSRLSLELKKILQPTNDGNTLLKSLTTDISARINSVDKVDFIISDVYQTNLASVELNLQDEIEMQNWMKTVSKEFENKWISGELLD
jgi:hypothetical protein